MTNLTSMRLSGGFTQGEPLDLSMTELVRVPEDMVEEGDLIYRVIDRGIGPMDILPNDILAVQPRPDGKAATSEARPARGERPGARPRSRPSTCCSGPPTRRLHR